jgi:alpha-glucosidase
MTDVMRHLRRVADAYPGRVLVAEAYLPVERLARYIDGDEAFHRAFDFELSMIDWGAEALRRTIDRAERFTPASSEPTWALSNHDLSRHASRFGEARARLAALLFLSLRGTICLYAGEEIGMVDGPDPATPLHDRFGRDRQRTPMQWDASPTGGFTSGRPWLPLVDPASRNVADQAEDPQSLLNLYRRLLALRREVGALRHGGLELLDDLPADAIAWVRHAGEERVLVVANMGGIPAVTDLSRLAARGEVMAGTGERRGPVALDGLVLDPLEGLLLRL